MSGKMHSKLQPLLVPLVLLAWHPLLAHSHTPHLLQLIPVEKAVGPGREAAGAEPGLLFIPEPHW